EEREQELIERQRNLRTRRPLPIPLQEELERILADSTMQASDRLCRVTAYCFGQEWLRTPILGTWESLPADVQSEVMTAIRTWMDEASPAPLPTGTTYSLAHLAGGMAFAKVLEDPATPPDWVTGPRITRWLPSALLFPRDEGYTRLLRRCHQADSAATEAVL